MEIFKGRDYRPAIVLLSDGAPTDDWEQPLNDFISNGRSSKCDRMAVAIGSADESVLKKFIAGCENPLFYAQTINIDNELDGGDIDLDDLDNFKI